MKECGTGDSLISTLEVSLALKCCLLQFDWETANRLGWESSNGLRVGVSELYSLLRIHQSNKEMQGGNGRLEFIQE